MSIPDDQFKQALRELVESVAQQCAIDDSQLTSGREEQAMFVNTCDCCGEPFSEERPLMEHRVTRPSDPSDLCCIMVSHDDCQPGGQRPSYWDEYFESGQAAKDGYYFLS